MDLSKPIQTIGVIGGGSAGYMAALYLKQAFPEREVTLIESSRIPVINVGEATTPAMLKFLHRHMNFPVQEFIAEARPTIKLGVKFVWGKQGQTHYNSPFGKVDIYSALYYTGSVHHSSMTSMLMDAHKTPFIRRGDDILPLKLDRGFAYHIDNRHFLAYMKCKLLLSGCRYLDTQLTEVRLTPDAGHVASLHDDAGREHRFDLYVDCSGFRSLLLETHLKTPWVSYAGTLLTNRAIVGQRENPDEIEPYTTATTMRHGWLWKTPMQHEDHLGYVFAKEFCSDDEAFAELKTHVSRMNRERIVNFRTGRHERSWHGNVVAIGNSFAFIEPLESTGLHMILRQLNSLSKRLRLDTLTQHDIDAYNDRTNRRWDLLRWFIALHFRFNSRLDTPFWKACREEIDMSGVEDYIEYYRQHGPVSCDRTSALFAQINQDAIFSAFSFDAQLAGCGVNATFFQSGERAKPAWPAKHKVDQRLVDLAIGHREALAYMEAHPASFGRGIPIYGD